MYTVMVTGGLGSGKSTLCKLICEHGAMSMNLDEIYRGLLESNENMIADLADRFGDDILDDAGMVIRSKLAEEAFSDEQSTKDLNAITFPYIMAMTNDYLLDVHCVPRSSSRVLVVEVPLLTEVPEFAQLADDKTHQDLPAATEAVSSPGGTTVAALDAMRSAGLAEALDKGVAAAAARSKELGA